MAGALVAGVAGLIFDWVTISFGGDSTGFGPFDDNVRMRLSDWADTGTALDGYAVILLLIAAGIGGVWQRATPLLGAAGGALLALAGIEIQYINSEGGDGVSVGLGVYALIVAGIALTVAVWVPAKPFQTQPPRR